MSKLSEYLESLDNTSSGLWASPRDYEIERIGYTIPEGSEEFKLIERQEVTKFIFEFQGETYAIEYSMDRKFGFQPNFRSLRQVFPEDLGFTVVYNEKDL